MQRAREMEEGVEPPPGYRPNYPSGIQVHPNGITVDSLAALFQAHAGIQAAALTALSQIDFTLIPNIERPAHTQVSDPTPQHGSLRRVQCVTDTIFVRSHLGNFSRRSITCIVSCLIWDRSRPAPFTGAKWIVTRRSACWKASRRVLFCYETLRRKSSCFPWASASMGARCTRGSSSGITSSASIRTTQEFTLPKQYVLHVEGRERETSCTPGIMYPLFIRVSMIVNLTYTCVRMYIFSCIMSNFRFCR